MKPTPVVLLASLGVSAVAGAVLLACNAVLGIERATLDDAGASVDPLTCANYCAVIMQNCKQGNLEYLSNDVCLKMCSYFPKGQLYPQSSEPDNIDSLGCRLWHANTAATHPEVHCRHAGPLGADLCGGPCGPFCGLDWHFCTDDNGINVYAGQVMGCQRACSGDGGMAYAEDSGDLAYSDLAPMGTGDTLNCRLWHLETAMGTNAATTHCPHTGQTSLTCR